jgi:CIC family chloride channel protein
MPDERRRPHARRDRAADHLLVVGVAVACGLAGAGAAIGLRFLVFVFQSFFFGHGMPDLGQFLAAAGPSPLPVGAEVTWLRRLWAPILGGLIVGPMIFGLAREAQGHGVPEVMVAIARKGGMIRPRVVAVKTVASAITIASGGSVGREGPIVQIGSAVGSVIGQLLRMPTRQVRTLVGCGAAAGIAATFNAPIAGALFATEIILGDFAAGQLTPIVIASVVATVVSRAVLGDTPSFVVPAWELVNPWELAAYSGLGVISAGVGLGFASLLLFCENFFERLRVPDMVKPALGGIAVGVIGIGFPHVFGSGYESINATLEGHFPLLLLAALLVAKVVATSVTLGSGGSGGIFAPALFLGAVTGGAFGHVVHGVFPASTASSGAYALVAMGAVVSAATHAPITAIIMMFEMTQSITIIPPLMTSCVIATLVAVYARRE